MAEMLFRTKVDMGPSGKARVYFTCHSDDFDLYFDKVCEYIFKTHKDSEDNSDYGCNIESLNPADKTVFHMHYDICSQHREVFGKEFNHSFKTSLFE